MIDYRGPDSAAIRPSDLARRLGFVALWRGRPINLVGGKPLGGTASNGVTPVLTHLGPAYSLSGSGTGGISMSPVPDSAPFTMLVLARSVTGGTSLLGRVMSTFNGSAGNDWYYDGGSHNIQVFTASTNSQFTLPNSLLTGSAFQCVAISLSGVVGAQTPIAYADGVPVTVSTVTAGSGARAAGGTTLGVGYRPDTTSRQAGGVFVLAAYATRHLSARELAQVTARPDLLLAPRRIWAPVSAGAVTNTLTASLSAAVQASRTATASIAAAVQEQRSAAASAAAAVQQARTTSASVAAAVRQDHTASASIAAAILQARTAAADIAAAVQQGRTASASIAAAVQAARSATASGSAAVQAGASVSASLSAQVQAGSTVAASLDVAVQAARSATAALAGAVQTPRTAQSSIAAAVAAGSSVTASLAAAVREARSAGASISAQVQAGTTIVAQIAAAILESKAASAAIAAAVAAARSTSAAIAAAVAQQHTVSATLAAAVRSGRVASAAVSAYISAPGDHTVSPRLYLVDPQDRAYLIDPEDRTYIVPASSRSTTA